MLKKELESLQSEELKKLGELEPAKVIDLRGAACPHPLNIIRDAIRNLGDREILKAVSDNEPTARENVPRFCKRRGYSFQIIEQDSIWQIYIQKIEKSQPRLRIINVSKAFKTKEGNFTALDDINLRIQEGEFVCFLGPSGCGKSTLLNLIAGLDKPSEGEIWSNGNRVTGPGPDRVVVFQEGALFPWLTVIQNVEFGLKLLKVNPKMRKILTLDYLELVGLDKRFYDSYIHQLSGGMKQRVAIARALAMEPSVLLMDEPFAALDVYTRETLQEELQRIWTESRKTIIFVTHNVQEAVLLGDRVVVFGKNPGRIKAEYDIEIDRPRAVNNPEVFLNTNWITHDLREEIEGHGDEDDVKEVAFR
ncbi:MAG TPA: ATP-binding cassette domain-containing protein [Thermodesulfobacteriota bacterium]|nr:ATP-binding cassette domain-containing protein [Thermodesulfobacteriota bacterium]